MGLLVGLKKQWSTCCPYTISIFIEEFGEESHGDKTGLYQSSWFSFKHLEEASHRMLLWPIITFH